MEVECEWVEEGLEEEEELGAAVVVGRGTARRGERN